MQSLNTLYDNFGQGVLSLTRTIAPQIAQAIPRDIRGTISHFFPVAVGVSALGTLLQSFSWMPTTASTAYLSTLNSTRIREQGQYDRIAGVFAFHVASGAYNLVNLNVVGLAVDAAAVVHCAHILDEAGYHR